MVSGVGVTLEQLRGGAWSGSETAIAAADQPAAIIFTTGSTGPPKGVLFTHGNFDAQVEQIRDFYGIRPGEADLPCFPMFGLFNCAMGRNGSHSRHGSFAAGPGRSREDHRGCARLERHPSVRLAGRVWTAWAAIARSTANVYRRFAACYPPGRPVPADVLRRMKECIHPEGDIHTPYGATEALPVASISATEVLGTTAQQTRVGAGESASAEPSPKHNGR